MFARLRQRYGAPALVTFVGASISALGGVSGMPAVVVVFGALVAAGGALWSSGERAQFERMLRRRADEIARLNREIATLVTGGDSFCYLQFGSLGVGESNSAILMLLHKGKYPMYDVSGYMTDLQKLRQVSDEEPVMMGGWVQKFAGGNMSPNSAIPLMNWQLPDSDEQDHNVSLNARNGFVVQRIRVRLNLLTRVRAVVVV